MVVLPLPEEPMTLTTSPRATSRSTPRSTSFSPKLLRSSRTFTRGPSLFADIGETGLQASAQLGERIVDCKINHRAQHIERQRLERAANDLLYSEHQVDDADQRHQGAALHRIHHRVDPWRQEAAQSLGEDDIDHALPEVEADRAPGFSLAGVDRFQRAPRHLGDMGRL